MKCDENCETCPLETIVTEIRDCHFVCEGGLLTNHRGYMALVAKAKQLQAENEILERRRGGECEQCGSWVCPPLTCMSCLSGQDLTSKIRKLKGGE